MNPAAQRQAVEKLAQDLRECRLEAEAYDKADKQNPGLLYPLLCGAIQAVFAHFIRRQLGTEAGAIVSAALEYRPTEAEIDAELAAQQARKAARASSPLAPAFRQIEQVAAYQAAEGAGS